MKTRRTHSLNLPFDRRTAALVCGSVAFHVAVLSLLGVNLAGRYDSAAVSGDIPLYLDIEPRPWLAGETARRAALPVASPAQGPARPDQRADDVAPPSARLSEEPAPPSLAPAPLQAAEPTVEAFARALRNSALGCRLGGLSPEEQERCDRRLAEAAGRAAPIQGTGQPDRDARFAAQGADALARYEDKRRNLKPYSRAEACPGSPNPSDPCAFAIQGRIWSSRDGWLPDLPRPH